MPDTATTNQEDFCPYKYAKVAVLSNNDNRPEFFCGLTDIPCRESPEICELFHDDK